MPQRVPSPRLRKRYSLGDRKSTHLNSNLPSFPPRLPPALVAPSFKGYRSAIASVAAFIEDAPKSTFTAVEKKVLFGRSEEHTSELQSPLFPSPPPSRSGRAEF